MRAERLNQNSEVMPWGSAFYEISTMQVASCNMRSSCLVVILALMTVKKRPKPPTRLYRAEGTGRVLVILSIVKINKVIALQD